MKRAEQALAHIAENINGKAVLEVACGCAEFSLCAAKTAESVTGIDLDYLRLPPQARKTEGFTFVIMDATNMTFADESFDTVVMYNAVGHLCAVLEKVLKECVRMTKNGGKIFVISSFGMDMPVIDEKLLPLLAKKQLSALGDIKVRQMMGEYIIYYRGKIAAYVCDNRLLVKLVPAAEKYILDAKREPPYAGAKDMLLVEEVDNREYLEGLFNAIYDELPAPKPKKKK